MGVIHMKTALPGPKAREWLEKKEKYIARAFEPHVPTLIQRGEGAVIEDIDGNRMIDLTGGLGVLNVGHAHPKVVKAIQEHASRFLHTDFTVIPYASLIRLAERLAPLVPGTGPKKGAFFNSGAEAVENAVKIAKAYTKRPAVIAFERAFHGRTWMAMTLTSRIHPYKKGFHPLVPEVYRAPYPYLYRSPSGDPQIESEKALHHIELMFRHTVDPETVAAFVIELVQGEGGFVVAPQPFIQGLQELARKYGILIIADEVQTGFGRTARMFASEHYPGFDPDLVTMAKSIADGMPISAVFGKAEIMDSAGVNAIGGTYVGNPVAAAAALAVLDVFEEENLLEKAKESGEFLMKRFRELQERHPLIGDVRGLGAMVAIELVKDRETKEPAPHAVSAILKAAMQKGALFVSSGLFGQCIRVLAPLNTPIEHLDEALTVLDEVMAEVEAKELATREPKA